MKILILANNDVGLYKFRKELVERLLLEHEVYISLPKGDFVEDLKRMGCEYIETEMQRHGKNPFADLKLLSFYKKTIKKIRPDAVLTYTIKPNVWGGIACRFCKVPYLCNVTGLGVAIENGGIMQKLTLFLYKLGLKRAKKVFFQNESNMKLFLERKITGEKAYLLPGSGVNTDSFSKMAYPEDDGGTRFLFIGRIMRDKGIDELIEAARILKNENLSFSVDVVGGYDGNYKEVIERAQNDELIVYHGQQRDVKPFIEKAHCVVLPSYHEGMANVLLEAASSARPVIATNIPGCKETFDEGVSGFGCLPKDAASLVKAMKKFIVLPPSQKEEMGALGRRKMEKEFDRRIIIDAYLEVINEIN